MEAQIRAAKPWGVRGYRVRAYLEGKMTFLVLTRMWEDGKDVLPGERAVLDCGSFAEENRKSELG